MILNPYLCGRHTLILFSGIIVIVAALISAFTGQVHALEPNEVLVVANQNRPESIALARHYMDRRDIPSGNIVLLATDALETVSRKDYNVRIAEPVRSAVRNRPHIRCLVLMYGIPLKVSPPVATAAEKRKVRSLRQEERNIEAMLKADEIQADYRQSLEDELKRVKKEIASLNRTDQLASVDSEIALVGAREYPLSGRIHNPYFLGFQDIEKVLRKKDVLMVSRLDGPTPGIVRRIIDDTMKTEAIGLKGTACFDARWPDNDQKPRSGYQYYDKSIHRAAGIVNKSGRMPVVVEASENLFKKGECQEAALYCGWYSLAKYIDAFEWQPGAIGFHIASAECTTLKKTGSQVWCKKMLEKGIAATIGPVGEPYVDGFPLPEIFFSFLVDGYLTLAECYLVSLPYLSWKMVLVGDPLYRPFKP